MSIPAFDPVSIVTSLARIGIEAAMEYHATRQAIGEEAARKRFLAKCRSEVALALLDEEDIAEARKKSDAESVAARERIAVAEAALAGLNAPNVNVLNRLSREDEPPDVMDAGRAAALKTTIPSTDE